MPACIPFAGCEGIRHSPALRNAVKATSAAGLWDQFVKETREGSGRPEETAEKLLKTDVRLKPDTRHSVAETLVALGSQLQTKSAGDADDARQEAEGRAARSYRLALQWWPEFESNNPDALNSLGYFLACSGATKEDGEMAEKLTRRALRIYDRIIAGLDEQKFADGNRLNGLLIMRSNIRDSIAWALYRQKRYEDALELQLQVIRETRAWGDKRLAPDVAELYYHLGAIHDKLGNRGPAIMAYEESLKLKATEANTHEAAKAALKRLRALPPLRPGEPPQNDSGSHELPLPPPPSSEPSVLA